MDPPNPLADNACSAPIPDVEADKENTPPEGRSTPTRDERIQNSSSSQDSLPCAVGNFNLKLSLHGVTC